MIATAFVPVRFSLMLSGPGSDDAGRRLVVETRPPGMAAIRPPDLLVLDPDAQLIARLPFDASAEETLDLLRRVLAARPDLAPPRDPLADAAYDLDDPRQARLAELEARWESGERASLAPALEEWLARNGETWPHGTAVALNLLGAARYHGGDFAGADRAWEQVVERHAAHPLSHRARYNRLDARSWPLRPSPDLQGARHPWIGIDRPVIVPDEAARDARMAAVARDPRYRKLPASGLVLVRIPAGSFTMGASDPKFPRERPLRQVTLSRPFWMAAWPVTRGLWRRFRPGDAPAPLDLRADDLPMAEVSRQDALACVDFLCELDGHRYRLPTEAEWEYAARGGLTGKAHPWGDEPPEPRLCNFDLPQPVPVASYPANGYGLFEMVGNTQEWVADAFAEDAYSRTPAEVVDPVVNEGDEGNQGGLFVARGGFTGLSFCRHWTRNALRLAAHRASVRVVAFD